MLACMDQMLTNLSKHCIYSHFSCVHLIKTHLFKAMLHLFVFREYHSEGRVSNGQHLYQSYFYHQSALKDMLIIFRNFPFEF